MRVIDINDGIRLVEGFFSPEECDAWIRRTEAMGYEDAPVSTARGPQMLKDIRNNTRVMFDDVQASEQIWARAAPYCINLVGLTPCGLNERLRFYRYEPTEQFDWHRDGWFEREGERSYLTFMVYLNEGFVGGATEFPAVAVTPRAGLAIFFVHTLIHRGAPLHEGRKYVLRTDVMFKRAS